MSRRQRWGIVVSVLLASVGCDQGTKHLAREHLRSSPTTSYLHDTFRLQYAENPGAFLSLGADLPEPTRRAVFTWAVGVFLLIATALVLRRREAPAIELVAAALFLGGGLSNWIDRACAGGRVVDFANLGIGPVRTGIFNVADVAVVAGVALLLFPSAVARRRPYRPKA